MYIDNVILKIENLTNFNKEFNFTTRIISKENLITTIKKVIIDAFQDVQVTTGIKIIKQGGVANNFNIIVSMSCLSK